MSLVPAKCPECGGNISVDASKKAAMCEFCKQPFVVEDFIHNFNLTTNVQITNKINANVVNVNNSDSKESLKKQILELFYESKLAVEQGIDSNAQLASSLKDFKYKIFNKNPNNLIIKEEYFNMLYDVFELWLNGYDSEWFFDIQGYYRELNNILSQIIILNEDKSLEFKEKISRLINNIYNQLIVSGPAFKRKYNFGNEDLPSLESLLSSLRTTDRGLTDFVNPLLVPFLRGGWLKSIKDEVVQIEQMVYKIKTLSPMLQSSQQKCTIFGNYLILGDDDSVKYVHIFKEKILNANDMKVLVNQMNDKYLRTCKMNKICPSCSKALSLFGKCKNKACSNYNRTIDAIHI